MPLHRTALLTGALLSACAGLTACGSSAPHTASAHVTSDDPPGYPVHITNCGTTTTYTSAPTRAVSNDINTTEDMLALGLESHMVGEFAASGSLPAGRPFPAQYAAGFAAVHEVSSHYLTLEQLVGLHPDFLFAGYNYGLQVGTTLTPSSLARFGIKTLALTESCAHVEPGLRAVSVADTFTDLTDLGEIFGVEGRAAQVIAGMKAQIASVQGEVAGLAKVSVFDYDSGTAAPFTGPGLAMPTAEIADGGGTNIFASLERTWGTVSWEPVVAADPDCIIINDYSTPSAMAKEQFLETSPITRDLTAVRNRCFLPLTYDEVTPGPRDGEAVVAIAHWLHPSAFGLPADGS